MTHPLCGHARPDEPYGIRDLGDVQQADLAIAMGAHTVQAGSPDFAIDREDSDAFIARWLRGLLQRQQERSRTPGRFLTMSDSGQQAGERQGEVRER